MRYYLVRARLRPGERMLSTAEGVRLVERNLGLTKCRFDSKLYAYRLDPQGIELVLGLPRPGRMPKIMHRIRILATTAFNRAHATVGARRWERGFDAQEISRAQLPATARRVGRPRGSKVLLDPVGRP